MTWGYPNRFAARSSAATTWPPLSDKSTSVLDCVSEDIDDSKHTESTTVNETIEHEIHAPAFSRSGPRRSHNTEMTSQLASSLWPHAEAEALFSVESPQALAADPQALALQHDQDPAVAEPRSRLGNSTNLLPQFSPTPSLRVTSATGAPDSTWRTAVLICSAEKRDFLIARLSFVEPPYPLALKLSLDQFFEGRPRAVDWEATLQ
jgi:hypothetical protein